MNTYITSLVIFSFAFLFSFQAEAQRKYDIYWVSFTDKQGTPYSVFRPQDYLSARAIERRLRYHIPIDSSDLPINPNYLQSITAKGFKIHARSKWLNGVAIITKSASIKPEELLNFDFVKAVFPIGYQRPVQPATSAIGPRDYNPRYPKKDT